MKAKIQTNEKEMRVELVIEPENDVEAVALALWVRLDKNKSKHAALAFTGLLARQILDDLAPPVEVQSS